jgi:hypothetical protein
MAMAGDSDAFFRQLDQAIIQLDERMQFRKRSTDLVGGSEERECSYILTCLLAIRQSIIEECPPSIAQRKSESFLRLVNDGWDPKDPLSEILYEVMGYYFSHQYISVGEPSSIPPGRLERIRDSCLAVRRRFQRDDEAKRNRHATHPDVLTMPHDPDKRSVDIAREAALGFVDAEGGRADAARAARDHRFLWDLSQQWLIVGLTDHWYKRPLSAVAFALRRGLVLAGEAIAAGYPAHAWDVSYRFLEAVALRVDGVAQRLIELHPEVWDHAGIKPVHWLVLRIRCGFALYRDRDQDLDRLLDDLQVAVFVDQLPAELADDLPELRNAYWLLKSLRMRDAAAFDRHLGERMAIRAASFRRGGAIAPMALCDLHALGLCRFARQRGMAVTVEHVYLPLGLLDEA